MNGYTDETVRMIAEKARIMRRDIVQMIYTAGSGHPGGSLSAADIIASLYFHVMRHRPQEPDWPDRDRFVLSKGHAAPALYAALAESGYFPVDELLNLRKIGHMLQGHPSMKTTPGVDMSTGSLGQGLSAAIGMALAGRIDGKDYTVYAMLGDGEIEEGQIWEAAMFAAHYRVDNLIAFLDKNGLQIDGPTESVISSEPLADKWRAFGWHVIEIDGHDIPQILDAVEEAKDIKEKPVMIIAHTVKGKGVSFMENVVGFHGKAPNDEQYRQAIAEIGLGEIGVVE